MVYRLLPYVGGTLLACTDGSSERAIDVRDALMKQYQMSNPGPTKRFLGGLDITRLPYGSILVSQRTYINSILKRVGMQDANPAPTPLCHKTRPDIEMPTDHEADSAVFQAIVGGLTYAATSTRPDSACAVAALGRYSSKQFSIHMTAAKRVSPLSQRHGRHRFGLSCHFCIEQSREVTRLYRFGFCWR